MQNQAQYMYMGRALVKSDVGFKNPDQTLQKKIFSYLFKKS